MNVDVLRNVSELELLFLSFKLVELYRLSLDEAGSSGDKDCSHLPLLLVLTVSGRVEVVRISPGIIFSHPCFHEASLTLDRGISLQLRSPE